MVSKVIIHGVPFDTLTMAELLEQLKAHLKNQDKVFMVTSNPEIVMYAEKDSDYRQILSEATYNIPDGIGIVIASQLLGLPIKERVTGFDTVMHLLHYANKERLKVYFLGAKDEVLQQAIQKTHDQFPHLQLVGARNGFFDWKDPSVVQEIQAKEPDLILVGMGFPRQEQWIHQHLMDFKKGLFIGCGGTIDTLAGVAKRAPQFWQTYHIEWLYRLIKNPSRIKRMSVLPVFMLKMVVHKLTHRN